MPLLVCVFFVAVTEHGHPASGKTRKGGIIALLEDPLSLFEDRSPGGRGTGALLPTKLALADGSKERVLSGIRDRDPGADDPGYVATPEALAADLPSDGILPGGGGDPGGGGSPGGGGFGGFGGGGGGGPGGGGGGFGGGGGGGPPFIPDPDFSGPVHLPLPPLGPIISAVPEPGTWAVMILGFFAVGAAMRRRTRRSGTACLAPGLAPDIECRAP